jgi:hypothetical protein
VLGIGICAVGPAKVRLLAAGARVRDVVPDVLGREALNSAEARRSYIRQEHHEDKRGRSVVAHMRGYGRSCAAM